MRLKLERLRIHVPNPHPGLAGLGARPCARVDGERKAALLETSEGPNMTARVTYAATTRTGLERKVAREIGISAGRRASLTIEARLVLDGGTNRWPGLVLVTIDDTDESRAFVRSYPGVTGLASPHPLSPADLDALTRSIEQLPVAPLASVSVGDVLEVAAGPFAGSATTVTIADGDRVQGNVIVFGRDTAVWFDRTDLRTR
jgi:transcription antitermination factor NusG